MCSQTPFTVLIVDDEPAISDLLSCILHEASMHVIVAQDGQRAIRVLTEETVDVVVTDIRMSSLSGIDLLEEIEKTDDTVKLIMMTGYDSHDTVRKALRTNAYDYLEKPLTDHDAIVNAITRACESVRLTRENIALIQSLQISNKKVNAANKRLLQLNKQLRQVATTDSVTSLYNRRYIDDWIQNYAFSNTSLDVTYSILLLNIDDFKSINDALGHDGGDKVLKHLASVLKNAHRETDRVGRYGVREFIVVMPGTDDAEAMEAAEKIRSMVESTSINVSSGPVRITVSIGVSTDLTAVKLSGNSEKTSAEAFFSGRALITQADKALCAAKELGRNRCVHYNELLDSINFNVESTG
ncbi:MAG: diguanylate cyclase [Granulosicoccus sp.]